MVVRYESSEDASKDIFQGYRRRTALDAETVAISNKSMKTMEDPWVVTRQITFFSVPHITTNIS